MEIETQTPLPGDELHESHHWAEGRQPRDQVGRIRRCCGQPVPEDIDAAWLRLDEPAHYGYRGDFSTETFLKTLDAALREPAMD